MAGSWTPICYAGGRDRDFVVIGEVVEGGEGGAPLRFDMCPADVLAGEGLDRRPRFPESDGQKLDAAVDLPPQEFGAAMAGQGRESGNDRSGKVGGVSVGRAG